MAICNNCSKEIQNDWAVCPFCGAKIIKKNFCPGCGKEMDPTWSVCPFCGQKVAGEDSVSGEIPGKQRLEEQQNTAQSAEVPSKGILTRGNYEVHKDILIPEGEKLVIEPGTHLRFAEGIRIIVKGILIASGEKNKQITFEPIQNTWGGIIFDGEGTAGSEMHHAVIREGGGTRIINEEGQYIYESELMKDAEDKVESVGAAMTIVNNAGVELVECSITENGNVQRGVIFCAGNSTVSLKDCHVTDNKLGKDGAFCIAIVDSNAALDHCSVSDNDGRGIWAFKSELELKDCQISSNREGGISCVKSTFNIYHNEIFENQCEYGNGAGIDCSGAKGDIINSKINLNESSGHGGGIRIIDSEVTLRKNDVSHNKANGWGGGLCICGESTVTISECEVGYNQSENSGGGLFLDCTSTIENCSISMNNGGICGGGICYEKESNGELSGTTITLNEAESGGGVYVGQDAAIEFWANQISSNRPDDIYRRDDIDF